ncbi:hypothetical protein ACGFNU_26385 [Spirillospora sp. NPDC048911]|uniref:hypothetical protein n=1 Tax=Spirillospora sp. NPDC048911 TaxID=3364527 RepID=UPI0037135AAC
MSGPEEPREPAEEAGAPAVPTASAPPSFGQVAPAEAETAPEGESPAGTIGFSPFGLEKPWWAAAESEESDSSVNVTRTESPEDTEDPNVAETEPPAAPPPSLDTLVAGLGVPSVDTRRAVPAEPIVQRPRQSFADTDPDGIPVIRPDAPEPAEEPPAPAKTTEGPIAPNGAAGKPTTQSEAPEEPTDQGKTAEAADQSGWADERPHRGEATDTAERAAADQPGAAPVEERGMEHGRAAEPQFMAAPVLIPDAILPAGITPPTDSSVVPAAPEAAEDEGDEDPPSPTIITPIYHSEGGLSIDAHPEGPPEREHAPFEQTSPLSVPPPPVEDRSEPDPGSSSGPIPFVTEGYGQPPSAGAPNRKPLLIASVGAGVLLAIAAAFALISGMSGDDGEGKAGKATPPPSRPAAAPSPTAPPGPPPVDISSEKTDRQPLALAEAYPLGAVDLGGRSYVRDKSSVNHQCALAARGAMAQALTEKGCRSVVRVTYLERGKALAVTTGIAAMPNKDAALKVSKAGSPSRYEWFRGMAGRRSQSIDQAGGYALSTVRGRYIIYAYAQYSDGKRPGPADQTLKTAARQFIDYSVRPINARAT